MLFRSLSSVFVLLALGSSMLVAAAPAADQGSFDPHGPPGPPWKPEPPKHPEPPRHPEPPKPTHHPTTIRQHHPTTTSSTKHHKTTSTKKHKTTSTKKHKTTSSKKHKTTSSSSTPSGTPFPIPVSGDGIDGFLAFDAAFGSYTVGNSTPTAGSDLFVIENGDALVNKDGGTLAFSPPQGVFIQLDIGTFRKIKRDELVDVVRRQTEADLTHLIVVSNSGKLVELVPLDNDGNAVSLAFCSSAYIPDAVAEPATYISEAEDAGGTAVCDSGVVVG